MSNALRPAPMTALDRAVTGGTCECCGREELKRLVKLTDGARVVWYGVGCAARAVGQTERVFRAAAKRAQDEHDAREAAAAAAARDAEFARWCGWVQARTGVSCPERLHAALHEVYPGGAAKARADYRAGL